MEVLGLVSVPVWLIGIVVIPLSLYLYTSYKQSYFRRLGISGPRPVPFMGVLSTIKKQGNLYLNAEYLKKHGKCFGEFKGNVPHLIVGDPDMIQEITIKKFSSFSDRAMPFKVNKFWSSGLTDASGDNWKFLRATLSPTFSSGKLKNMIPIVQKCLGVLQECIEKKTSTTDHVDMKPLLGAFTMDVICSTAFGIETDSQRNPDDFFVKNARKAMAGNPNVGRKFMLSSLFPELSWLFRDMDFMDPDSIAFFRTATMKVIKERRQDGAKYKDLLQLMVNAHKDQRMPDKEDKHPDTSSPNFTFDGFKKRGMTDEEVIVNSIIFLLAGFDTTATAITWLCYCLATNLDCQETLYREIEATVGKDKPTYETVVKMQYLDMVVSETLRMYNPAVKVDRQASEDVEVCGVPVKKGLSCVLAIYAIHHDPDYWPDPDIFNPDRFSPENKANIKPGSYIPFGSGPRNCIGMRLALLEVKIVVVSLLQRYKLLPTATVKVPPVMTKGSYFVKLDDLVLQLENRSP